MTAVTAKAAVSRTAGGAAAHTARAGGTTTTSGSQMEARRAGGRVMVRLWRPGQRGGRGAAANTGHHEGAAAGPGQGTTGPAGRWRGAHHAPAPVKVGPHPGLNNREKAVLVWIKISLRREQKTKRASRYIGRYGKLWNRVKYQVHIYHIKLKTLGKSVKEQNFRVKIKISKLFFNTSLRKK